MEKESLKIRFNGADEIDLETLTNSLHSTLECLKIVADDVLAKDDYCKFVVKNVEKGSFVIDIAVLKEIANTFIPAVAGVVTTILTIFEIRKHLKGKKPKEIKKEDDNQTTIINAEGKNQTVNTTVFNIYASNTEIERKLAQLSSVVAKDDKRTSLVVEENDSNGKIIKEVTYEQEEVASTCATVDMTEYAQDIEENINNIWLKIKKLYFQGNAKWDFYTDIGNQTISAVIEDYEFLEKIRNNAIYVVAETKLFVKLKVVRKLDKQGKYLDKGQYIIIKVLDVIQPKDGAQMTIDDLV